jgi:hypothetical protein
MVDGTSKLTRLYFIKLVAAPSTDPKEGGISASFAIGDPESPGVRAQIPFGTGIWSEETKAAFEHLISLLEQDAANVVFSMRGAPSSPSAREPRGGLSEHLSGSDDVPDV